MRQTRVTAPLLVCAIVVLLVSCANSSPQEVSPRACAPDAPLFARSEFTGELPDAPNVEEFASQFERDPGGYSSDVAVVDQDWQTRVLTDDHSSEAAEISPDGERIAFTSSRGTRLIPDDSLPTAESESVYAMDASGDDQRRLTGGEDPRGRYDGAPQWSADGERVAFTAGFEDDDLIGEAVGIEGSSLWVSDTTGDDPERLVSGSEGIVDPAPSPGGERVAYSEIVEEDGEELDREPTTAIRVAGRSTPERELSEGPYDSDPVFSPGGGRITFVRGNRVSYEGEEIRTVDADGGEAGGGGSELVVTAKELDLDGLDDIEWSPDSRRLAFEGSAEVEEQIEGGTSISYRSEVGILEFPSGSSDPRVVWSGAGSLPEWTPDSGHLVYSAEAGEAAATGLKVVTAEGEQARLPEAADELPIITTLDWGSCSLGESD